MSLRLRNHMPAPMLADLLGKRIEFLVPWSAERRAGTITRIGATTIWFGAWCYSISQIRNAREIKS